MKCLVFAPVLVLFLGCAAQPEQEVSDAKEQQCQLVYRTGSNVPIRDCSAPQTDAERQRTLDTVRDMTKNSARPGSGG
jgi:hypothetical protein